MELDVDAQNSDFEEEEEAPLLKPKKATTSRTTTARGKKKAQQSESDDYEEEEPAPKKRTTTRAKKEPAKKDPAPKKPPARSNRSKKVMVCRLRPLLSPPLLIYHRRMTKMKTKILRRSNRPRKGGGQEFSGIFSCHCNQNTTLTSGIHN